MSSKTTFKLLFPSGNQNKVKFDLDEINLQSKVYDLSFFVTCVTTLAGQLLDSGFIFPFGNASKTAEQKIIGLVAKHRYTTIDLNNFALNFVIQPHSESQESLSIFYVSIF